MAEVTAADMKEMASVNGKFPIAMIIAGLVLMVAASVLCENSGGCEGEGELVALILAIVNIVLAGLYMALVQQQSIGETLDLVFCVVLFGMWVVTAGIVTFDAPFIVASNGWIGAWGGVIASLGNLVYSSKFAATVQQRMSHQSLPVMLVIGASIVVIIAAVSDSCCNDDEIIAIVAGVIGLIVGFVRILIGAGKDRLVGGFLAIVWLTLGVYLTFTLFPIVNNGYLGCWTAIAASCYLFITADPETQS